MNGPLCGVAVVAFDAVGVEWLISCAASIAQSLAWRGVVMLGLPAI